MAVRSDGSPSQHLAGPAVSSPTSGDVTLGTWHEILVVPGSASAMFKYHNNSLQEIGVYINPDGTVSTLTINGGGIGDIDSSIYTPGTNVWNYYTITRSGSAINIYAGTESTGVVLISSLTDAALAAQGAVWRWTALGQGPDHAAAQFRLYNRLLTTTEMDTERINSLPSSTTNLWTSNPFTTAGSYGDDGFGSSGWTFSETGGTGFSTVAGPSPSAGVQTHTQPICSPIVRMKMRQY